MYMYCIFCLVLPNSTEHVQTIILGAVEMGVDSVPSHCHCVLVLPETRAILRLPKPHCTHLQTLFRLTNSAHNTPHHFVGPQWNKHIRLEYIVVIVALHVVHEKGYNNVIVSANCSEGRL